MKKNELVKSMNLTFNRIGFQLQKKSRRRRNFLPMLIISRQRLQLRTSKL